MSSSVRDIRQLLETRGIALKKRWGQNFLVNRDALDRIVRLLDPGPEEPVWEIGGGTGALTAVLLERCSRLVVFEIDHGLVAVLQGLLEGRPRCGVVAGDFVSTFPEVVARDGPPLRVVGNLPYSSASRIIAVLAGAPFDCRRLVFTVQRELAERMAARPSTKAYSSFSVLCQARFQVKSGGDLGPGSFYPPPRVSSRIVLLEPHPAANVRADLVALQRITRHLFATRRKTIRRSLATGGFPERTAAATAEGLRVLGIGTERRPEELSVAQFVELSRLVGEAAHVLPGEPEADAGDSEDLELPED
jgi:16S rRNA (adenine1518-N6/adenine1519-N6)-dimethyltransferase